MGYFSIAAKWISNKAAQPFAYFLAEKTKEDLKNGKLDTNTQDINLEIKHHEPISDKKQASKVQRAAGDADQRESL